MDVRDGADDVGTGLPTRRGGRRAIGEDRGFVAVGCGVFGRCVVLVHRSRGRHYRDARDRSIRRPRQPGARIRHRLRRSRSGGGHRARISIERRRRDVPDGPVHGAAGCGAAGDRGGGVRSEHRLSDVARWAPVARPYRRRRRTLGYRRPRARRGRCFRADHRGRSRRSAQNFSACVGRCRRSARRLRGRRRDVRHAARRGWRAQRLRAASQWNDPARGYFGERVELRRALVRRRFHVRAVAGRAARSRAGRTRRAPLRGCRQRGRRLRAGRLVRRRRELSTGARLSRCHAHAVVRSGGVSRDVPRESGDGVMAGRRVRGRRGRQSGGRGRNGRGERRRHDGGLLACARERSTLSRRRSRARVLGTDGVIPASLCLRPPGPHARATPHGSSFERRRADVGHRPAWKDAAGTRLASRGPRLPTACTR